MLTAQVESFIEGLDELRPLLDIHYRKLALNQDEVSLNPQYEVYFDKEIKGELLYITLRTAGRLVGYWIAFIAPGLHYRTCLTAHMDIWNILPECEGGMAPLILMRAVEREYIRRGVNRSFIGEKLHRPSGRLVRAFGYEPVETHYSKWLS